MIFIDFYDFVMILMASDNEFYTEWVIENENTNSPLELISIEQANWNEFDITHKFFKWSASIRLCKEWNKSWKMIFWQQNTKSANKKKARENERKGNEKKWI